MRMGKKRGLGLVIAGLLSATFLSACHGAVERNVFEIPQEFDTTKEYEITFWAKNDTNIKQTKIYEQAIRDFEGLYPNITINPWRSAKERNFFPSKSFPWPAQRCQEPT